MYDGSRRAVQDIVAGDVLMGDDNTPRIVQPHSVMVGEGEMFKIKPSRYNTAAEAFTCNAAHILVLINMKQPWIERSIVSQQYCVQCIVLQGNQPGEY